ncbi:MAG: relaxase domain-containing protein [Nitrospirae bacterium]|nr:relaxase domain-containing protein [Nitrospirota bacterium]
MRPVNLSAKRAKEYYYERDPINNAERDQRNTQWHGKGAAELGLEGIIHKEDFEAILEGRDPHTGQQLIAGGGVDHDHRAGTDTPLSAPKSVSIACLHNGDERLADAQDRAVAKAINQFEGKYAQYRVTRDGETTAEVSGNWVAASFRHSTSRENDPQLHSHVVIANMTRTRDGQWRATCNDQLFAEQQYVTSVYNSFLAKEVQDLGYAIETRPNGTWEIAGYDQRQIEQFSKRSEAIEQREKELEGQIIDEGLKNKAATLDSRPDKDKNITAQELHDSWDAQDTANGINKEHIMADMLAASLKAREASQNRVEPAYNEYDYMRLAASISTEQESVFTKAEVLKISQRLSYGEQTPDSLERAFDELSADKEIIRLDQSVNRKGATVEHYTTREMDRKEGENISMAWAGQGKVEAITTPEAARDGLDIYESMAGFDLTRDQRKAADHILTSQDRYVGIEGDPGTGKTTVLHAVRLQAEVRGCEVVGLGFTGKSASEIEAAAGIKSQTLDSFLSKGHDSNHSKQLWIVDEASMVSSKKANELFRAAEDAQARVVMIGDTKQLQSIEAGRPFLDLKETGAIRTVRMQENLRQKGIDERAVADDLNARRIDQAIDKMEAKGRIHEIADRHARLDAIVNDYCGRKSRDTIIVTDLNKDRNELNTAIHNHKREEGQLKGPEHTFTVRESKNLSPTEKHFAHSYQRGDVVIANKAGLIGRSGTESRVIDRDEQKHTITLRTKDNADHIINLKSEGQSLAVYREKEQCFCKDEKVVFTKNDKGLKINNGNAGTIKSIDKNGDASVEIEKGREVNLNLKTQYNYVDQGYAVSTYKSQGGTYKHVMDHADTSSRQTNFNERLVSGTRHKETHEIYTNDRAALREQMKIEQCKTSTLDFDRHRQTSRDRDGYER